MQHGVVAMGTCGIVNNHKGADARQISTNPAQPARTAHKAKAPPHRRGQTPGTASMVTRPRGLSEVSQDAPHPQPNYRNL